MAILQGGIFLFYEVAIGTIDGTNDTFSTSFLYVPGTLRVLLNGLELTSPGDFVEIDTNTFEFVEPPIGGSDSDIVTVYYQKA